MAKGDYPTGALVEVLRKYKADNGSLDVYEQAKSELKNLLLHLVNSEKLFAVTMYRHGNHELHSYVLGIFSTKEKAKKAGYIEKAWRGNKYTPEITEWEVDGMEFDTLVLEDA